MHILVLNWRDLAHPKAGGAEVFTDRVTRVWAQRGHDVTWFCAAVPGLPADDTDGPVRIVRRGSRLSVYREARDFFRETEGEWDLVVDEVNTRPFLTPRWVGDTPSVALIHQVCREIWWHEAPLPVALAGRYWLERHWLSAYRRTPVLTVSASSRDSLRDYGLSDVTVVPEGIDPAPPLVVTREARPTVVFVGRLTSNKRPLHALRAFHRLRTQMPDAQLWVIGDGPERARLQREAGPGVTLHGRVSDADKSALLGRAHVLVATAVREGWGLVVDEAAAVGTPTIGYDVPGLRDSVAAARGTLVPPRPAALADTLVAQLPRLVATPASAGWRGGAQPWDVVADAVLTAAGRATTAGVRG